MDKAQMSSTQLTNSAETVQSPLIDAEQLGRLMMLTKSSRPGAAAAAVNQRLHRGYPMPPPVNLPGTRRRVWLRSVATEWLMSCQD